MSGVSDDQGQRRRDALDGYEILDSAPEQCFDDIVLLARQICDAPMALLSLVAEKRQWFKATSGVEIIETPIEESVCALTMQQSGALIIPDLTHDPRTRDNPQVTTAPYMRFYAGATLTSATGVPIGTVCVIDTAPRPDGLSPQQTSGLEALARQVMALLESRRTIRGGENDMALQRIENVQTNARALETQRLSQLLKVNEARLRMAQEAGKIGSFEIDIDTDVMTVTDQFCRIYGLAPVPTIPAIAIQRLIHPDDTSLISTKATRQSGDMPLSVEYRICRADTGDTVWVSRRAQFLLDADQKPIRLLGTVHDITERKAIEDRQLLLGQELSHRLKNTLALVQAIAAQTLRGASDKAAVRAFESRIGALARAHDVLLQQSWVAASLRDLMVGVLSLHGDVDRYEIDGPDIDVGSKAALSLSLLLHELATNAIKHGALSVPGGRIVVLWHTDKTTLTLIWSERGGPPASPPLKAGLGSRLINMGLAGTGGVTKSYDTLGLRIEFKTLLSAIENAELV